MEVEEQRRNDDKKNTNNDDDGTINYKRKMKERKIEKGEEEEIHDTGDESGRTEEKGIIIRRIQIMIIEELIIRKR